MSSGFRWFLLAVGGVLALIVASIWFGGRVSVPDGSVLVLELQGEYVDAPVNPTLARLFGDRSRPIAGLLQQLSLAERDERLHTVALRIRPLSLGWGRAEEIRQAVARVRAAGREVVAHLELEGFGNAEYFIASAADRVVLAPGTRAPFVGLAAEYLFLGGLFEKLGVEFEYERIGRFKSAVEQFANTKMSDANREMTTALLDSIEEHFVAAIAEARDLSVEQVRSAIDEAPTTPAELEARGLTDGVAHWDELETGFGDRETVEGADYAFVDPSEVGYDPVASFALVYGSGPVLTGNGAITPSGQRVLASDTVAQAILDAAEDPEVEAILFRINSPGGSPLASDIVWRAVERAREEHGKPVVASFSDVAASGGYYVACGADRIVSQATTYTGSIGVYSLRPMVQGLLEKLGVGVEAMTRGARADLLLVSQPLSPEARSVLRRDVESIYDQFVGRVADGRELSTEAVDAIGRGRVWTGAQAKENGLVDALGGLRVAIGEAKELAGLAPDDDVVLVQYPAPRPLAEELRELLGVELARARLPLPPPIDEWLRTLAELPSGTPLLLPPTWVTIR